METYAQKDINGSFLMESKSKLSFCSCHLIRDFCSLFMSFLLPVHAGTLGECPNRGYRCYLEINGVFGCQQGQDRYYAGGETEARRDCSQRGGRYISNSSVSDCCAK